uniref:Uncharacterized protein n=1 Tax=Anguilla anguilla TaxID=7936 RepID=A0A0E9PF52_ANGAN
MSKNTALLHRSQVHVQLHFSLHFSNWPNFSPIRI